MRSIGRADPVATITLAATLVVSAKLVPAKAESGKPLRLRRFVHIGTQNLIQTVTSVMPEVVRGNVITVR
jgi:hypothetical protein